MIRVQHSGCTSKVEHFKLAYVVQPLHSIVNETPQPDSSHAMQYYIAFKIQRFRSCFSFSSLVSSRLAQLCNLLSRPGSEERAAIG